MDIMFHAPYIFRGILLILAAGLPLAIWAATGRREKWQMRWLVLLFLGLALVARGGMALTALVSNVYAAEMALREGTVLIVVGAMAVCWSAFGLQTGRHKEQGVRSSTGDETP